MNLRTTLTLLLLAGVALSGCKDDAATKGEENTLRPVRSELVLAPELNRNKTFTGVCQAGAETRLSFKVGGNLKSRDVAVGKEVDVGQVLAGLDPEPFQLQVNQAAASVSSANAGVRAAKKSLNTARELYESGSGKKTSVDQAQAQYDSARAQASAASQQRKLAELNVSYTELVATSKGVVSQVLVEENENVSAGQPIVVISSGAAPEVKFNVPADFIGGIDVGDAVTVSFPSLKARTFTAKVTEKGIKAEPGTSTYAVIATLDAPDPDVLADMAARGEFALAASEGDEKPGVVIPHSAVANDRNGDFVFVVDGDEKKASAKRRTVTRGEVLHSAGIRIAEGLEPGERVVTAGVHSLTDGQAVRLVIEPRPNGAAAPPTDAPAPTDTPTPPTDTPQTESGE